MWRCFLLEMGGTLFAAAATLAQVSGAGEAAAQEPKLKFETASVQPAQSLASQVAAGRVHTGMTIGERTVDIGGLSLADLVPIAFGVKPYQVSGPDWLGARRFDVLGTIPQGVAKERVPEMLQTFLENRFGLVAHRERRVHDVYALVVGKDGPKLKAADAAPDPMAPGGSPARFAPEGGGVTVAGAKTGLARLIPGPDGSIRFEASRMSIDALADTLSRFAGRPVVNMTQLPGNYRVGLDLSNADAMNAARAAGASAGSGPSNSMAASIRQLGLALEPRTAPVETIVIDHIEKEPLRN